jgi:hypothetical protein
MQNYPILAKTALFNKLNHIITQQHCIVLLICINKKSLIFRKPVYELS